MKRISYKHYDKSEWGPGPWQREPDKVQWPDKATGLPCLMVRNQFGAWCGYVGVSKGHPMFEQHYEKADVDVHGGLTFAGHCMPEKEGQLRVCHTVEEGEDDNVWWLGFDCAHWNDMVPDRKLRTAIEHGTYRDLNYVRNQVAGLAKQLKEGKYERQS